MAVSSRQIRYKRDASGELSGRTGVVYDVNIKYKTLEGKRTYSKKGFATKKEALAHEAEMRAKLTRPGFVVVPAAQAKRMLGEYLLDWLKTYGKANLRTNTFNGYQVNIKNHIIPSIGNVALQDVSAESLDRFYNELLGKGLSTSTVKYVHRTLSVALEHARKYRYVPSNPTRDIVTRFQSDVKTPEPFTIDQIAVLMKGMRDTDWEIMITLAGLYGLRRNEMLGLRWENVKIDQRFFSVEEQLSANATNDNIALAPVKQKSSVRTLPITAYARDVITRHRLRQNGQKEEVGSLYHDNGLVVCKPNGDPISQTHVSHAFSDLLEKMILPHIRFHDLRHSAATNMHELTGDFFTVGEILGHSLKGTGIQLGMTAKIDATTKQYVNVRLERKEHVLNTYHEAVKKSANRSVKKRREMER